MTPPLRHWLPPLCPVQDSAAKLISSIFLVSGWDWLFYFILFLLLSAVSFLPPAPHSTQRQKTQHEGRKCGMALSATGFIYFNKRVKFPSLYFHLQTINISRLAHSPGGDGGKAPSVSEALFLVKSSLWKI